MDGEEWKVVDKEVCRAEGGAVDVEKGADVEEGAERVRWSRWPVRKLWCRARMKGRRRRRGGRIAYP